MRLKLKPAGACVEKEPWEGYTPLHRQELMRSGGRVSCNNLRCRELHETTVEREIVNYNAPRDRGLPL